MQIIEKISHSTEETNKIAAELACKINAGSVIALYGEMGSGKTTFTQGFAKALGVKEIVNSPTFAIVHNYPLPDNRNLYHIDLYRIESRDEISAFDLEEILNDSNSWTIIEWPEKIESILPENAVKIQITTEKNPNERLFKIIIP